MAAIALVPPPAPAPPPVAAVPSDSPPPAPTSSGATAEGAGAAGGPTTDAAPKDPAAAAVENEKLARAKAAAERATRDAQRRRERDTAAAKQFAELEQERGRVKTLEQQLAAQRIAADENRSPAERAEALRHLGINPKSFLQAALHDGTPEAQLEAQVESLIAKKFGVTPAELRQVVEWKKQQDAEAMRRADEAGYQAIVKAASDATKYPNLAKHPPSIIASAVRDTFNDLRARNAHHGVTAADIFEYLEDQYAAHANSAAPVTTTPQAATPPTDATPNDNAGSTTLRTVTNSLATPRAPVTEKSISSLPRDEQIEAIANKIKAAKK